MSPFIGTRVLSHHGTPLDRLTTGAGLRTKVLITSSRSSTENNRAIIYDARVGTSLLHGYANDKRAPDRPAFWNPTFVCAPRRARPPSSSFNVSRRPLCFILRSPRGHSIFPCYFIGFEPVDSFHGRDLTLKYLPFLKPRGEYFSHRNRMKKEKLIKKSSKLDIQSNRFLLIK